MPKIREIWAKNRMIKAVALEDFVNKATGLEVKRLQESGTYDTPGAIPNDPNDTSWIFPGSVLKSSRINKDSAVLGGSYLDVCRVTNGSTIYSSDAKETIFSSGKYVESIINFCTFDSCKVTRSRITAGKESVIFSASSFSDTTVEALNSKFEQSVFNCCNIYGTKIKVSNSSLNNVLVISKTSILGSDISPFKHQDNSTEISHMLSSFRNSDKDYLFIENARVYSEQDLRIFNVNGENICVFSDNWAGDNYSNGIASAQNIKYAFEEFSNDNDFVSLWFKDKNNINSFILSELKILEHIFTIPNNAKTKLKNILLRDFFEATFSDRLNDLRLLFTNSFSIDIFNSTIVAPNNLLFVSKRMFDFLENCMGICEPANCIFCSVGKNNNIVSIDY